MTTTVEALITDAKDYAATMLESASDALDAMNQQIGNVGYQVVLFDGANLPAAPEIPDALTAPTLSPVDLVIPTEPGDAPVFQGISPIEVGTIPDLTAVAPTITIPSLPSQLAEFTQTPPTIITDYDFPDPPPALSDPFPTAPVLVDHAIPVAPTVALPSFDGVAPVNSAVAPTDLADQFNAAYRDIYPTMVLTLEERMDAALVRYNPQYFIQMAAIEDQLTTYLAGGTGLDPTVENAIYERARGKENAEFLRTERAAFQSAAARGFTIPDGAAFSAIQKARQSASDNNARSSNEIAIKQAEMEQANLQFAINVSKDLRASMLAASISYHGNLVNINGQALDYAKSTVQYLIQVYNLAVEAFRAQLDAYKAEVQVYDARLKAALSYIDLYEAEIRALQALTNVDQSKVALYRGQIDALNSLANVYETQIKVVIEQASLEKLKLDLFKTQVEAFTATAQAKESEYRGFTAAMSGQESLVKIYSAQVDAHNSEINGFRAKIDAQSEVVRATATTNQALATQYKSQVDAFSAIVAARGDVARTQIEMGKEQLQVFDSQVRAILGTVQLQSDVYKAQSQIILENTKMQIDTLTKNAELNTQYAATIARLGTDSAKVYGDLAGAALSGMNTLAAQTLAE